MATWSAFGQRSSGEPFNYYLNVLQIIVSYNRQSWSDELIDGTPNVYVYAANNPSESILAKRRGYGTLVSYNVPPYGRAGLYLELAALKDLVNEYRTAESSSSSRKELRDAIFASCEKSGVTTDIPLASFDSHDSNAYIQSVSDDVFDLWVSHIATYLVELEERLFSSGLHTLGTKPTDHEIASYLNAFFKDKLSDDDIASVIAKTKKDAKSHATDEDWWHNLMSWLEEFPKNFMGEDSAPSSSVIGAEDAITQEAVDIAHLLSRNTEELDSVINALNGGYVLPAPGGDLLRDGTSVLPTGRNIHALDPYRMPSALAWARGSRAAEEIIEQHKSSNNGAFPETVGELTKLVTNHRFVIRTYT
jgi:magnesium chelatase subunit H